MNKDTTKEAPNKGWKPLSIEEREEIAIGLERGESQTQIACRLGRNKSTISREIRRNGTPVRDCRYRANRAQTRADSRKRESRGRERIADRGMREYAEVKLKEGWTPERIAGRMPLDLPGKSVSHETIYQWIYRNRRDLVEYLVCGHKTRHKRSGKRVSRVGRIPGRIDITERPASVETREEEGHWEADTVVSRQSKGAAAVFVERKHRLFIAVKIHDKSAAEMTRAAILALGSLPEHLRKTITFDNGLENAEHEKINAALGTSSYFCKPYHSWEKGSVENRNGILRRYFPKKHNWDLTSQEELDKVICKINSMPMKCLAFRTPYESFGRHLCVALAG